MSRLDAQYVLFNALLERLLDGEQLSPEDQATFDGLLARDGGLREEADVLLGLRDLDVPPTVESRALAEAALQAFRSAESAVDARPRHRVLPFVQRHRHALLACAAATVAVIGAARWASPGEREGVSEAGSGGDAVLPPRVELVYAAGQVDIHTGDGPATAAQGAHGRLLSAGHVLEVAAGNACFVLDPGIDVCLDRDSRLRISDIAGGERRFVLEQGRVALQLAHQPRGFSVTVEANGVASTAVGTSFSVAVDGDHGVSTTVMEGRVRVEQGQVEHFVDAHNRLMLSPTATSRTTLTRTQEAAEWAVMEPARLWQGRAAAILHVSGAPAGADVWLDGQRIGESPLTSLVPSGSHALLVRRADSVEFSSAVSLDAGKRKDVRYELQPMAVQPEPVKSSGLKAESEQRAARPQRPARRYQDPPAGYVALPEDLLSEAHRLMAARRFEQAAQTYEALRKSHPNSPEAHAVLVALAHLELEHRDNPRRARSLLAEYLKGKAGPLSQEARHLRILTLRAEHKLEDERRAIVQFLQAYPESFQRAALENRLSALRSSGNSGSP